MKGYKADSINTALEYIAEARELALTGEHPKLAALKLTQAERRIREALEIQAPVAVIDQVVQEFKAA